MQRSADYNEYVPNSMKMSSVIKGVKKDSRSIHDATPQQPLYNGQGNGGIASAYETEA